MESSLVVAIPSNTPGGLEAKISDHFGHCDFFTLINIQGGKIAKVDTVANVEHGAGGCLKPVNLLKEQGVQAIVVGGIGARPMQAFAQAGIDVYYADRNNLHKVEEAAGGMIERKFPMMRTDQVCQGGGDCQH